MQVAKVESLTSEIEYAVIQIAEMKHEEEQLKFHAAKEQKEAQQKRQVLEMEKAAIAKRIELKKKCALGDMERMKTLAKEAEKLRQAALWILFGKKKCWSNEHKSSTTTSRTRNSSTSRNAIQYVNCWWYS